MSEWVELLLTYDDIESHLVKGILESENIQVVIDSMKISPYPVSYGRLGEVRVMVKKEELDKAKSVLSIMMNAPDNGDE